MIYAPIIIPTLCRYEHFVRCVESLKSNTWAKYTDVYIALDYPAKDNHWEGYKRICDYLNNDFSEFKSFNVIRREKNFGAGPNMREARNEIYKYYDRMIRTDDDTEFSPNFLEYIDKCLMYYEHNEDVIAVTGYSYPIKWECSKGSNIILSNCMCSMWGTGFWRDKYNKVYKDLRDRQFLKEKFPECVDSGKINLLPDARYIGYIDGALSKRKSLISSSTDVAWSTYLIVANKFVVMPVLSKVRNHGYDGSGSYCQKIPEIQHVKYNSRNYPYAKQKIDTNLSFDISIDTKNDYTENRKRINEFDCRDKKDIIRVKRKLLLYKIVGIRICQNIISIMSFLKRHISTIGNKRITNNDNNIYHNGEA